jgi:hypothetical protein
MLKLAVAFVQTEDGKAEFGPQLPKVAEDMLLRYEKSYLDRCRKLGEETKEARRQVDGVVGFLHAKGKFDEYVRWAKIRARKQKEAAEAEFHRSVEQQAADDAAAREKDRALAEQRRREAHEREMKRMEYAFKLQEAKVKAVGQIEAAKHLGDDDNEDVYVAPQRVRPVLPRPRVR